MPAIMKISILATLPSSTSSTHVGPRLCLYNNNNNSGLMKLVQSVTLQQHLVVLYSEQSWTEVRDRCVLTRTDLMCRRARDGEGKVVIICWFKKKEIYMVCA